MGVPRIHSRRLLWTAVVLSMMALIAFFGRDARATTTVPDVVTAANRSSLPIVLNVPFVPPKLKLVPFTFGFENKSITVIAHAGDERLFIGSREGKVWIVYPDGSISPNTFLDMSHIIRFEDNFEQGLLGLAFHPDFPDTPYFYFAYTTNRDIEIARGVVNPATPNYAAVGDVKVMMRIRKPDASGGFSPVHNAGDLTFGPDGYLYIPLGDGGPDPYDPKGVPGDPNNNSQRRTTMLGSILRIDPNPTRGLRADCGDPTLYSIPGGNPWLNDEGCDEIWAMGLRNPWRISIDAKSGDMYIADVGEWLREEVNFIPGGAPGGFNFGWHCWEGNVDYTQIHPELASGCSTVTNVTFPVFEYDHSHGECSVIGGVLYRGEKYPTLYGRYFFGDFCTGQLWTMGRVNGQWKIDEAGLQRIQFTTFGANVHGELYGAGYGNGTLYKVVVE